MYKAMYVVILLFFLIIHYFCNAQETLSPVKCKDGERLVGYFYIVGFGRVGGRCVKDIRPEPPKDCTWNSHCVESELTLRAGSDQVFVAGFRTKPNPLSFSEMRLRCCLMSDQELVQCTKNTYRVTKKSYTYALRSIRKKLGKHGTIKDVKIQKLPGENPFYFLVLEICGVSDTNIEKKSQIEDDSRKDLNTNVAKIDQRSLVIDEPETDEITAKLQNIASPGSAPIQKPRRTCKLLELFDQETSSVEYRPKITRSRVSEGTIASVTCAIPGYVITDEDNTHLTDNNSTFVCSDRSWDPFEPKKCIRGSSCPKFSVTDGDVDFNKQLAEGILDGGTATMSCDTPGAFVTNDELTPLMDSGTEVSCNNGRWSLKPTKCVSMCKKFSLSSSHLDRLPSLSFTETNSKHPGYVDHDGYAILECRGEVIAKLKCQGTEWMQENCENCFQYFNDVTSGMYWLSSLRGPWVVVRRLCTRRCSDLASFHSNAESEFGSKLGEPLDPSGAWFGLTRTKREDDDSFTMKWTDGTSIDFDNFSPGNPDGESDKQCAFMTKTGEWDDEQCRKRKAAICRITVLL